MERTVSITIGQGSLTHNDRSFIAENVDPTRTHLNVEYVNDSLKKTYHELFDEAVEKYNAKQKQSSKRIEDYYEKIRCSKKQKLFFELIVQLGNCKDTSSVGKYGDLAKEVLDEYMSGFFLRNHSLYVFSAHLHMDESTPHLHIDFVPLAKNSKRGLETRVSLKQALLALGFEDRGKEDTECMQWIRQEKDCLAEVMARHGITRVDINEPQQHLSVLKYKKREISKEIEELTSELTRLKKSKDELSEKMSKYLGSEWELGGKPFMMSAANYRSQIAQPLVDKLKREIEKLTFQLIDTSKSKEKAVNDKKWYYSRCIDLSIQNNLLREDSRKLEKIKRELGEETVKKIVADNACVDLERGKSCDYK